MAVENFGATNKRISKLEVTNKLLVEMLLLFSNRFCFYWITETKKQFAVITRQGINHRTKAVTADLVVIDADVSGGSDVRTDKEIWIYNPVKDDDANPKAGKYEPILDPDKILELCGDKKEVEDAPPAVATA